MCKFGHSDNFPRWHHDVTVVMLTPITKFRVVMQIVMLILPNLARLTNLQLRYFIENFVFLTISQRFEMIFEMLR